MCEFDHAIDDLLGTYESEIDKFSLDLVDCVLDASVAGVEAMQQTHPYTDRTNKLTLGMHCKLFGPQTKSFKCAVIQFKAPYAKFVNDGTVKTKAYPFLPLGEKVAEDKLEKCVDDALGRLCHALARGA